MLVPPKGSVDVDRSGQAPRRRRYWGGRRGRVVLQGTGSTTTAFSSVPGKNPS